MKLSVVIAAYNEKDNIEELTRRLDGVLRGLPATNSEMIFVVEGHDGTKEILERLSAELGRIRILYAEKQSGLGSAFRRGFAAVASDADLVLTMDADLNHEPEEIPRLLEEIQRSDLDMLVGSRFIAGSRNEGIPLWKWVLSILMNRLIASLFDVEIRDKTSGFRVYRAQGLRRLTGYRNNDFAFLPEMLIRATEEGLRIGEAPIHFTFRTRGKSKMAIAQTSRSYLILLRSRFDRWSAAALALIAVGSAVRLMLAFPVHKFVPDADSLLTGLLALDILDGKLPVFYSGVRIGAVESYMHAPAIWLLGVSRTAISIAPLLSGVATLFLFFFFVREILGRRHAVLALLFLALASPSYMAWTYMPNGYPETMLLCVAILYLAARTARTGHRDWSSLALGLAVGLGVWQSVQTLTCAVPALAWLFWLRQDITRSPRFFLILPAGLVLGASPWILYNIVNPLGTFHGNFAIQPAGGLGRIWANAIYFLRYDVPALFVGMTGLHPPTSLENFQRLLRVPAVVVYLASLLMLLPLLRRRRQGTHLEAPEPRKAAFLLVLLAVVISCLNIVSAAGGGRGWTVRYILPLLFVAAAASGVALSWLWQRNRFVAVAAAATVLVLNLLSYDWPWTIYRRYWRDLDRQDRALVALLEGKKIQWVCGNYWVTYPINFASARRVRGIPFQSMDDYYSYARDLGRGQSRWALVVLDVNTLRRWLKDLPLDGHVEHVADRFFVFFPSERETARWTTGPLIEALQRTAPPGH